ncbi:MAG: ParA family protein, partial [Candidatus Helarchaeales archaeon]
MGPVISFINLKGGVGKTTCCANIAGELAHENRKILVIDADAQANLSTLLLNPKRYAKKVLKINGANALDDPSGTIYQIFLDEIDGTNNFNPNKAILKNVVEINQKGQTIHPLPKLDLLPASHHLMELERKIVTYSRTKYVILYKTLQKIKKDYDLILIDCPPNIYTATHNALYASDYYIIPTSPEFLARTGIPLLINSLNKTIEIKEDERNETVKCAGILINLMDKRLKIHTQDVEKIRNALEVFKKNNLINKDAIVFNSIITSKSDIKTAASRFAPICITHPRSPSTAEFK